MSNLVLELLLGIAALLAAHGAAWGIRALAAQRDWPLPATRIVEFTVSLTLIVVITLPVRDADWSSVALVLAALGALLPRPRSRRLGYAEPEA